MVWTLNHFDIPALFVIIQFSLSFVKSSLEIKIFQINSTPTQKAKLMLVACFVYPTVFFFISHVLGGTFIFMPKIINITRSGINCCASKMLPRIMMLSCRLMNNKILEVNR